MNFIKQWAGVVALVILAISALFGDAVGPTLSGVGTRFPYGLSVDSTSPVAGLIRGTDLTITDDAVVENFTRGGNACAITDANGGTYTLTDAELDSCSTFTLTASGAGQEVVALTFPATSTMALTIPNAGDCRDWLYDASAVAAATTTTLTAGTGHDIIAATTNDDLIDGAEFAQITMCRQSDSDVTTYVNELLHAD